MSESNSESELGGSFTIIWFQLIGKEIEMIDVLLLSVPPQSADV